MTIGGCLQKAAAIGALRMPGVKSLYVDGTTFVLKHFFPHLTPLAACGSTHQLPFSSYDLILLLFCVFYRALLLI